MLAALAQLHSRGLALCDLRPCNVLLSERGGGGRALLSLLGAGRLRQQLLAPGSSLVCDAGPVRTCLLHLVTPVSLPD
jgi:hypothetical protein